MREVTGVLLVLFILFLLCSFLFGESGLKVDSFYSEGPKHYASAHSKKARYDIFCVDNANGRNPCLILKEGHAYDFNVSGNAIHFERGSYWIRNRTAN